MQLHTTRKSGGITLVELMFVIAIIGVLAGIASLGWGIIERERVSSATRTLLSELQKARLDGMVTGSTGADIIRGSGIRFVSPTSYVLFHFNDCNQNFTYDTNGCSGAREETQAVTQNLSSPLVLKMLDGGTLIDPANNIAKDILIFDRSGFPRSYTWSQNMKTIVLMNSSTGDRKCVTVHINRIREGLWNGTECREQ